VRYIRRIGAVSVIVIARTAMSKWVGVCDEAAGSHCRLAVLVLLPPSWCCCERRLAFVRLSEYTAVLWLLGTDMLQYISSQQDTQTCKTRHTLLTVNMMTHFIVRE
jgi:hypothetical protein